MIKFTLPIVPKTKKNSPMILWKKQPFEIKIGKVTVAKIPYTPFIVPSAKYSEFEVECIPYFTKIRQDTGVIDYPINMECKFYVNKRLKYDLTNLLEAIDDTAVKSGFLLDDNRDIIAGHDYSRVLYDKFNPVLK